MACERGHTSIVDFLLTDLNVSSNSNSVTGETPLACTQSKEIAKLLLQHGAIAEDAYIHHRRILGNIFSKDPPVKMFVIGHGGEGKSTLIEAMQHEPNVFTPFVSKFTTPKEVKGVSQKTAGIIPRVFKSRFYGDVLFCDFAGQEAYYSSHDAIIKSRYFLSLWRISHVHSW